MHRSAAPVNGPFQIKSHLPAPSGQDRDYPMVPPYDPPDPGITESTSRDVCVNLILRYNCQDAMESEISSESGVASGLASLNGKGCRVNRPSQSGPPMAGGREGNAVSEGRRFARTQPINAEIDCLATPGTEPAAHPGADDAGKRRGGGPRTPEGRERKA